VSFILVLPGEGFFYFLHSRSGSQSHTPFATYFFRGASERSEHEADKRFSFHISVLRPRLMAVLFFSARSYALSLDDVHSGRARYRIARR